MSLLLLDVVEALEERLRRRQLAPGFELRRPPAVDRLVLAGDHGMRASVLGELTDLWLRRDDVVVAQHGVQTLRREREERGEQDRKSTRLNSSHRCSSYDVICLQNNSQAGA